MPFTPIVCLARAPSRPGCVVVTPGIRRLRPGVTSPPPGPIKVHRFARDAPPAPARAGSGRVAFYLLYNGSDCEAAAARARIREYAVWKSCSTYMYSRCRGYYTAPGPAALDEGAVSPRGRSCESVPAVPAAVAPPCCLQQSDRQSWARPPCSRRERGPQVETRHCTCSAGGSRRPR